MKKIISVQMILILSLLCGCDGRENTATQFVLNTVAEITADCDNKTIGGAFSLCSDYENMFSRTISTSDVYKLNNTDSYVKVSDETVKIINRSLYYSELTSGKFDITICSVSKLWNFADEIIPEKKEIAEALKNVDYHSIEVKDDYVNLNGKEIDLGSIAKGYIADRVKDYLVKSGAKNGIINLGGNLVVFGKEYKVGIQKPFSDDIIASIKLKNKTAVTSGTYQRYIERDGQIYHHILDPKTGYGVKNDLTSVTVIGDTSFDCDALSTCCMLLGLEDGLKLINQTENTEAIFIDKDERLTVSTGLSLKGKNILFK